MQHVVNIAFDFDDDRVKKIVENGCVEKINKELKQDVIDAIYKHDGWGSNSHGDPRHGLQDWVKEIVADILKENREEICKLAAHEIVQSMNKSSKWKNMIVEEVKKNES